MVRRITDGDVRYNMGVCNALLDELGVKEKLEFGGRYGYYAIDTDKGYTLQSGLSKRACYDILFVMSQVLGRVKRARVEQ